MDSPAGRTRSTARRRLDRGVGVIVGALVASVAASAVADTQTLQVSASPNPQATVPMTITATGTVGVPSAMAIYAALGATGCAAQAADEAARGAKLVDQRTVSGSFSFGASFTPAVAGAYDICTYLDGSSGGTVEHQNESFVISVAAAPVPPPTTTTPTPTSPAPQIRHSAPCVVPDLRRHTLRGAEHFLAIANCKLGRVYAPSVAGLRMARRRAHGHAVTEIVVSQSPAPGTVHIGGYTVAVRLGFGSPPRTGRVRPTP